MCVFVCVSTEWGFMQCKGWQLSPKVSFHSPNPMTVQGDTQCKKDKVHSSLCHFESFVNVKKDKKTQINNPFLKKKKKKILNEKKEEASA